MNRWIELKNSLNLANRSYYAIDGIVFLIRQQTWTTQEFFLLTNLGGRGRGTYSEETMERLKWNSVFISYQWWYFDVDRKWPTVEDMVYIIETLWENSFIFFRTTDQTLTIFSRNFPQRGLAQQSHDWIFWWSIFEECFLNNILRVLNEFYNTWIY